MNKENDDKLMSRFGHLYRERSLPMSQTCMCWGFDCGDGWFKILWDLSDGIDRLLQTVSQQEREEFRVKQVKEKFGTLRYYYHAPLSIDNPIHLLVRGAENLSAQTCEKCGEWGKIRGPGWLSVRCNDCYDKANRKENEDLDYLQAQAEAINIEGKEDDEE